MHLLNQPTMPPPLATRLSRLPAQITPTTPIAKRDRRLLQTHPKPKSQSNVKLLSRLSVWASTLLSRMSSPKLSDRLPSSSMLDQDTTTTSTMPCASMSRCSTITKMNSESSTKKERTSYRPESGTKRKRDDLVNLELPTSTKKRMKGRREKEETQDLDARKVPMTKDQMTMNEGLRRDQESMSPSSHGSLFERLVMRSFTLSCNSLLNSSRTTPSTSKQHAEASQTLLNAQSSPTNSGSHSSQEKLLISTQSLQPTTPP